MYKLARSRTGFFKYKDRHSAKQERFNINMLEEAKLVMHMEMLMEERNYIMEEYGD